MKYFIVFILIVSLLSLPVLAAQTTIGSNVIKVTHVFKKIQINTPNFFGSLLAYNVRILMPTEALIMGICGLVSVLMPTMALPSFILILSGAAFYISCLLLPYLFFLGSAPR
jgi:hypothetical protein